MITPRILWRGRLFMVDEFRAFIGKLKQTGRLMIGVPDYDAYVQHRKTVHPGMPVMTYEEFFRNRQENRYGGSISGCC